MARQDTVSGFQNYQVPLTQYTGLTETALLAPNASGVYAGFPSPTIPISTSTYPTLLWAGVAPDIAGSEFDGHPFEVKIAGKVSGVSGTNTLTLKLWQAAQSVLLSGPSSTTYGGLTTHPPSGTGINSIAAGAAITLTSSVVTNFVFNVPLIWDSVSQKLNIAAAPSLYAIGATVTVTPTASTSSVAITDLNFFPTFTFGTAQSASILLTELSINRL